MEVVMEHARRVGYLFYVASPNSHVFSSIEEVPNYFQLTIPHFVGLVLLEMLVIHSKGEGSHYQMRWNDLMTSGGHGILYTIFTSMSLGVDLIGYQYLYERRLVDLDWKSPLTWWIAAIGVDLAYYWVHRMVHEVNIGWGAHQVHHSSEDYNLSTALRQSIFQKFFNFGLYLPLAVIGVPLPAKLVHAQFNLLYQFWIHTELVTSLGPLEWILNTPSHHRVHHGSNPWCLDKNYGGVLIIWDRIFGTFEPERRDEKIIYGLVDQPQTFNIPWLQAFYHHDILSKAAKQANWVNTMKCLFYGPAWSPGTPRLGHPITESTEPMKPRKKYNPTVPRPLELYLISHFFISLFIQQHLLSDLRSYSWVLIFLHIAYLFVSLGNIGAMYDGWRWAGLMEAVRCAAFLVFTSRFSVFDSDTLSQLVNVYCALSALVWTAYTVGTVCNQRDYEGDHPQASSHHTNSSNEKKFT